MAKRRSRLQRFIEPGLRSYFIVFFLYCAALTVVALLDGNKITMTVMAVIGIALGAAEFAAYLRYANRRKAEIMRYIDRIAGGVDEAKNAVIETPFPTAIIQTGSGEIIWTNAAFTQMTGEREHSFEFRLADVLPDFSLAWLTDGGNEAPSPVRIGEKWYTVCGSTDVSGAGRGVIGTLYFIDCTEFHRLREIYAATRPVVGIIQIDNYDEINKDISETQKSAILAAVDDKINEWTGDSDCVLKKYDRDRYLMLCDRSTLDRFIEGKFSILDAAKQIVSRDIPVTLSIGFGVEGANLREMFGFASLGIDMALSRGGDQAVIKNKLNFSFYGGRTQELEKRTKIRSRVTANALCRLARDSSRVFVMGHKNSDLDSVGAAAGVVCICRALGVEAHIVLDRNVTAARVLVEKLERQPEYAGVFVSPSDAMIALDPKSLLVIVDVNRPEVTEAQELLESANRIAVIDHHRRAASYISNAALNLHEPYASSASELVVELISYIEPAPRLLRSEAEALLAGIELDTKSFTMRTGVRTFEAAASLRLAGADPIEIKRLFQTPIEQYSERCRITAKATLYRSVMATVLCEEEEDRVTAAQAADELLTITGVQASFIVFPSGGQIVISARSLGNINVQVILEKLGGGGHLNMAGAQITGESPEIVMGRLYRAIDNYLADEGAAKQNANKPG